MISLSKKPKMRIGVDLHGVLDKNPEMSRLILKALMDAGHAIFVISGPPSFEIIKSLKDLGLKLQTHYTSWFSIVDFLQRRNVEMWKDDKDTWWANDKDWWSSKAEMAKILELDVMIDNSEEYAEYFEDIDTKFFLFTDKVSEMIEKGYSIYTE